MKFSRGTIILIILALALMFALAITLTLGGNRSRHGYGSLASEAECDVVVFSEYMSTTPVYQHP